MVTWLIVATKALHSVSDVLEVELVVMWRIGQEVSLFVWTENGFKGV